MCVIWSYNHMYVYVPCNVMSLSAQTRTGVVWMCVCWFEYTGYCSCVDDPARVKIA